MSAVGSWPQHRRRSVCVNSLPHHPPRAPARSQSVANPPHQQQTVPPGPPRPTQRPCTACTRTAGKVQEGLGRGKQPLTALRACRIAQSSDSSPRQNSNAGAPSSPQAPVFRIHQLKAGRSDPRQQRQPHLQRHSGPAARDGLEIMQGCRRCLLAACWWLSPSSMHASSPAAVQPQAQHRSQGTLT